MRSVAVACLAALALAPLGLAQNADGEDRPGAAALESYLSDRITARERAIDRLTLAERPDSDADRFVRDARAAMHKLARELWITTQRSIRGRLNAEAGGVAAHAAIALEKDLGRFEQAVAALPGAARRAVRSEGSDSPALKRLSNTVEVVKAFTSVIDGRADAPALASRSAIDDLLVRAINPLVNHTLLSPDRHERAAWFPRHTVEAAHTSIDAQTLASVRQRIRQTPLNKAATRHVGWLLRMIERAADQPHLRPRAAATLARLRTMLESRATLRRADWLGAEVSDRIDQRVQEAIAGLAESADDSPAATLSRLQQAAAVVDRLSALTAVEEDARDRLRLAFESGLRAALTPASDEGNGGSSLLTLLDDLTAVMAEAEAPRQSDLPTILRRARNAFQHQYQEMEQKLLADLAAVDRGGSIRPALHHRLQRLRQLRAQVRRLDAAPAWVDRMSQLNRHARSGFQRQLRRLAEDLLDAETHEAASTALADLEAKLAWAHALPREPLLAHERAAAAGWPSPSQAERLRHRLTVARSRWAAAWSAGIDPSGPGKRLSMLRRLLIAGHRVRQLNAADADDAARLRHWAGWLVPTPVVKRLRGGLTAALDRATDAAGGNDWDATEKRLRALERALAVPWLAHRLTTRMRPLLPDRPGEAAEASVMRLHAMTPPADAFLAERRDALGWLALTAEAWRRRGGDADDPARRALLQRASGYAQRLLDAADGRSPNDAEPQKPAVPVSSIDL